MANPMGNACSKWVGLWISGLVGMNEGRMWTSAGGREWGCGECRMGGVGARRSGELCQNAVHVRYVGMLIFGAM